MSKLPPTPQPSNTNTTRRLRKTSTAWQSSSRPRPKRLRCSHFTQDLKEDATLDSDASESGRPSDIYEFNQDRFVQDVYFSRNVRPLPAFSTMLALASQKKSDTSSDSRNDGAASSISSSVSNNIPILRNFFDSLQKVIPIENLTSQDEPQNQSKASSEKDSDQSNCELFDQVSTVLTHGHHKRFREILQEMEKDGLFPDDKMRKRKAFASARSRKIEFQKLCELLKEERRLYSIAIEKFKIDNANKFLTGFRIPGPASSFVEVKSKNYAKWLSKWQNAVEAKIVSNHYGTYTQEMSLKPSRNNIGTIGSNIFQPQIVFRNTDSLPILKSNWRELALEKRKLEPCFISEPSSALISQDEKAKSLALEHKANIVLTSQTLETLLLHHESFNTKWSIPLSYINVGLEGSQTLVLFVENPLPTSSTPRECLSVGIQEALRSHAIHSTKSNVTTLKGEDVYTLLTIPRTDGCQKVLVRSRNYLISDNSKPVLIFSKLEYFLRHGYEEYTAHQRAVWLLHKILQADCEIFVGRVDVTTTHLLDIELKSIADALTPSDHSTSEQYLETLGYFESRNNSSKHKIESLYGIMVNILSSLSLVAKKVDVHHILCYPGRSENKTVLSNINLTVHSNQNVNNVVVDVEKELKVNATAVSLNENSLRSCFCLWQWKHNRLPYTFPYSVHIG